MGERTGEWGHPDYERRRGGVDNGEDPDWERRRIEGRGSHRLGEESSGTDTVRPKEVRGQRVVKVFPVN